VTTRLELPALQFQQGHERTLYTFVADGKLIPTFTTVSRIKRQADQNVYGYQRPESLAHIAEIRNYLNSENPMIPNALVVAFDETIRFEPAGDVAETSLGCCRSGTIVIPVDENVAEERKPGWIVDGQQRLAAIREARLSHFPMCVVAFVAKDQREQADQFILVNSTKPLDKSLIYELLPTSSVKLSSFMERRRFSTFIMSRLNYDENSPLRWMIRTPTNLGGVIKDNSVLSMIENSLSDGVLYRFRASSGEDKVDSMLGVLKAYWTGVAEVFKEAWGLSPQRSRLMHGDGIVGMGYVMDAISDRFRSVGTPSAQQFRADLESIKDICRWTDGYWEFGPGAQRKWNEIQNTPKDIKLLANYLLVQYKGRVWNNATQ
jgi:DGQHR domain-containing protein